MCADRKDRAIFGNRESNGNKTGEKGGSSRKERRKSGGYGIREKKRLDGVAEVCGRTWNDRGSKRTNTKIRDGRGKDLVLQRKWLVKWGNVRPLRTTFELLHTNNDIYETHPIGIGSGDEVSIGLSSSRVISRCIWTCRSDTTLSVFFKFPNRMYTNSLPLMEIIIAAVQYTKY